MDGTLGLTGAQTIAIVLSAGVIAVAVLSPFVLTPQRLERRYMATGRSESLDTVARWHAESRWFWVLILVLASGLPGEIRNTIHAHQAGLKLGHAASALLLASVILQFLLFRSWARARKERGRQEGTTRNLE